MSDLPTGVVTFLFTDIEGSTRLLHELGDRYEAAQDAHSALMREAIRAGFGVEVATEGDSFFAAFASPADAVRTAVAAQRALASHPWPEGHAIRVRMGMHTGVGRLGGDNYLGIDVNTAARIAAAAHGGQVLVSDASRVLTEHDLPAGVTLRDLGRHRLKDLPQPERLFDLVVDGLPSDFPPVRSLEIPVSLPPELTSFVGRERELQLTTALLERSRLVTLTGPGGSGKTRLAIRAAQAVKPRFEDGVYFVDLGAVTDTRVVPSAIASVLGLKEEGPRPQLEGIIQWLGPRSVLLVLDNFEQILDAAPTVGELLAAAPDARVLVTSRAPLHIRGEQEHPIPPLPVPAGADGLVADELLRSEAVALFVERATDVDPRFVLDEGNARVIVEICRRLDGLPLAIELAASRIRLLTPQAILERLDRQLTELSGSLRDVPDRQRTLRGAIGWSYDLLDADTQTLFRRLSAFAGGWTLDAAETVSGPSAETGPATLDGLATLVDHSLVRKRELDGELRFDMLHTIGEFAYERLNQQDDAGLIRRRHAEYYVGLAEREERRLRGLEQEEALAILEAEHDNLRMALRWTIDEDEGGIGLRLVAALWRFWHLRGYLSEGRRWSREVLALSSAEPRTLDRARALAGAGGLAYWQTDVTATQAAYEEAFAIASEIGDRLQLARATYDLAFARALAGKGDEARALLDHSIELSREAGSQRGVADGFWMRSLFARFDGDFPRARKEAEESLRLHRELGDRFGTLDALHMLGRAAYEMGDLDTARASFLETILWDERLGNRTGLSGALDNLAAEAIARGDPIRALKLGGASEAIKESVGGEPPPALIHLPDPREAARESLSEDQIQAAWDEGRAMSTPEALAYARGEP